MLPGDVGVGESRDTMPYFKISGESKTWGKSTTTRGQLRKLSPWQHTSLPCPHNFVPYNWQGTGIEDDGKDEEAGARVRPRGESKTLIQQLFSAKTKEILAAKNCFYKPTQKLIATLRLADTQKNSGKINTFPGPNIWLHPKHRNGNHSASTTLVCWASKDKPKKLRAFFLVKTKVSFHASHPHHPC